jgi:hypothetical protein
MRDIQIYMTTEPDFFLESADSSKSEAGSRPSANPERSGKNMRKFDYRAPRFSVDLPIRLTFEDSMQDGRCREISTEGMKLELREPLSPNSCGRVRVSYLNFRLELPVRVAHSGASYDGVKFVYESDEQRDDVNRLVAVLAGPRQQAGPLMLR